MALKYENEQYAWVVAGLRNMEDIDWSVSNRRRAIIFDGPHAKGHPDFSSIVFTGSHGKVTQYISQSLRGIGPQIVALMYPCIQRDAQTETGAHEGQYFMNDPIWERLNREEPALVEVARRRDRENRARGIRAVEVEKDRPEVTRRRRRP